MCRLLLRSRRDRPRSEPHPDRRNAVTDPEVDYFALANVLIDQHGMRARDRAARLMEEAVKTADAEAAADWCAVGQAIALLTDDPARTMH